MPPRSSRTAVSRPVPAQPGRAEQRSAVRGRRHGVHRRAGREGVRPRYHHRGHQVVVRRHNGVGTVERLGGESAARRTGDQRRSAATAWSSATPAAICTSSTAKPGSSFGRCTSPPTRTRRWQQQVSVPHPDGGESGIQWGTSWDGRRLYPASRQAKQGTLFALDPATGPDPVEQPESVRRLHHGRGGRLPPVQPVPGGGRPAVLRSLTRAGPDQS